VFQGFGARRAAWAHELKEAMTDQMRRGFSMNCLEVIYVPRYLGVRRLTRPMIVRNVIGCDPLNHRSVRVTKCVTVE